MGNEKNQPQDEATIKLLELQRKATAYDALDLANGEKLVVERNEYSKVQMFATKYTLLDFENNVLVPRDQFNELVDMITEYKGDIVALVNVFQGFAGLFEGKSTMQTLSTITSLIKSKEKMAGISNIVPIIEKYTTKPAEING